MLGWKMVLFHLCWWGRQGGWGSRRWWGPRPLGWDLVWFKLFWFGRWVMLPVRDVETRSWVVRVQWPWLLGIVWWWSG